MLFWTCDVLSRPTWRNLDSSFEGWAYRNGFLDQIHRLEARRFLESHAGPGGERLHRLSHAGCLRAMGGRDPEACWERSWDGRWRMVLFDVPEDRSADRNKLRDYLRSQGFGYLQKSVWVTPDPLDQERKLLAGSRVDVGSLLLLEAQPCAGETNAEIVSGAWDFTEINRRYAAHREILARRPYACLEHEATALVFHAWLREERAAWNLAVRDDPLLPKVLLPSDYEGRGAWQERVLAMTAAGEQMRTFRGA